MPVVPPSVCRRPGRLARRSAVRVRQAGRQAVEEGPEAEAERIVRAAFRRKRGPELLRVDVPAFLAAAEGAFPAWTRTLQNVRHTVVFAGSALALTAAALV